MPSSTARPMIGAVYATGWPGEITSAAPIAAIAVVWLWLLARNARSSDGLWGLPSALFRYSITVGAAIVAASEIWYLRGHTGGLAIDSGAIVESLDAVLYELGLIAFGSLA